MIRDIERLLTRSALLVIAAFGWFACCVPESAAEKPNVLMIMVDDLRPMLGCYGDPLIKTPNIDRLARRSVVFERAYCQYAKCGTSRLSLMTGLRPDAIGVFSNNERDVKAFRKRRPDAASIANWLWQHGYHTQSFGKIYHDGWDNASDWSTPSSPGRDREMWEVVDAAEPMKPTVIAERLACPVMQNPDVPDDHLFAGRMTGQVLKAFHDRSSDQPAFFAVGYRRPHLPFVAPKKYFDLYQPDESWLPANPMPADGAPVLAWFNSDGYVGSAKRIGLTMPIPPNPNEAVDWNGYEMRSYLGVPNHGKIDRRLQLELRHAYAACVSYVDAQIGQLLDGLEATQGSEDTVVILCSDHGWHLGEQSAWGKMTNFEIATRVPLMISAPGFAPGRSRSLAELVDLYPTICQLVGLPSPKHIEGECLVESLREPGKMIQTVALSQYARYSQKNIGRAVRTNRFRFVQWTDTNSGRAVGYELYDHEADPNETVNVAESPKHSEDVARLKSVLQQSFVEQDTTRK